MNKNDNDLHPYNDLPENANQKPIPTKLKQYSLKRYLPDDVIKYTQEYGNTYPGIIFHFYNINT